MTIETRTTATRFFSAATSPAFNEIEYCLKFKGTLVSYYLTDLHSEQTRKVGRGDIAWPSVGGTFQQRVAKAPLHIG